MNVATILKAKGHEVESIGPDVTLGDAVRLLGAKRIGAVLVMQGLNDSVDQLMDMMTEGRFRHLPVMDEGKLVGVISIGDVVKHRIAETVMETEALKLYIANS